MPVLKFGRIRLRLAGQKVAKMLDESRNGQTVPAALGDRIEIELRENPTTGYRWHVIADGAPSCKLIADTFTALSGPPGKGGAHRWTFEAVATGECEIVLRHRRGWAPPQESEQNFTIHVHVGSDGRARRP